MADIIEEQLVDERHLLIPAVPIYPNNFGKWEFLLFYHLFLQLKLGGSEFGSIYMSGIMIFVNIGIQNGVPLDEESISLQ